MHATDAAQFRGHLHSGLSRLLAGVLVALARGTPVAVAAAAVLGDAALLEPPLLVGTLVAFAALPGAAAWLVERTAAATATVGAAALTLQRPDLRIEVARAALAGAVPWRLPLPGPGVSLLLRSGERLAHGVETADPLPLLASLGQAEAAARPVVAWAHARALRPAWRWWHLGWKFPAFALAPTAVFFNAHQHIAYGGTLGQYYLAGLAPYLETFALYWLVMSLYLVLWASVWRGLGEAVALAAAHVAPSRAARVRRGVEVACRVAYYAGVPALVVARFLA